MSNQFFNSIDSGKNNQSSGSNTSTLGGGGGGGGGGSSTMNALNLNMGSSNQPPGLNANQFMSNFQNQLPGFQNNAANLLNQLNAANNSGQNYNKQ